jgi:hypothetical protein
MNILNTDCKRNKEERPHNSVSNQLKRFILQTMNELKLKDEKPTLR